MAMENEDYGDMLQESRQSEDLIPQDHDAHDHGGDAGPVRVAFSRRVPRTSKQPWYEPYLREIRRAH